MECIGVCYYCHSSLWFISNNVLVCGATSTFNFLVDTTYSFCIPSPLFLISKLIMRLLKKMIFFVDSFLCCRSFHFDIPHPHTLSNMLCEVDMKSCTTIVQIWSVILINPNLYNFPTSIKDTPYEFQNQLFLIFLTNCAFFPFLRLQIKIVQKCCRQFHVT